MDDKDENRFSDEEAQRRFETLLEAALNTPPAPMKDRPKKGSESKARRRPEKQP
jgi:hypothetical protein